MTGDGSLQRTTAKTIGNIGRSPSKCPPLETIDRVTQIGRCLIFILLFHMTAAWHEVMVLMVRNRTDTRREYITCVIVVQVAAGSHRHRCIAYAYEKRARSRVYTQPIPRRETRIICVCMYNVSLLHD